MKRAGAKYARKISLLCACAVFFLTDCAPATPSPTPQVISVYTTAAAQPWLTEVYACAEAQAVIIRLSASPPEAQISLRLGEARNLTSPAYQIGSEDLLVAVHAESALQNLTAEDVRALFSRPEGQSANIWVFASGEDVQQTFTDGVMLGMPVTSLARVASNPQEMSNKINADKNAVGILPRHWKAGKVREVFSLPGVPVLAVTPLKPQGALKEILACLQK